MWGTHGVKIGEHAKLADVGTRVVKLEDALTRVAKLEDVLPARLSALEERMDDMIAMHKQGERGILEGKHQLVYK